MRCIETLEDLNYQAGISRLIVTWDVLKQQIPILIPIHTFRLIVTWDVLKQNLPKIPTQAPAD